LNGYQRDHREKIFRTEFEQDIDTEVTKKIINELEWGHKPMESVKEKKPLKAIKKINFSLIGIFYIYSISSCLNPHLAKPLTL